MLPNAPLSKWRVANITRKPVLEAHSGPHGMTRTISFSARHVSTRSLLCLATCHCSGHTWGWTLSCTKTLCPIWGRNIARWSWCSASIWSCSCSLFQQRFVPSFYLKLACETSLKIVDGISIWKSLICPRIFEWIHNIILVTMQVISQGQQTTALKD